MTPTDKVLIGAGVFGLCLAALGGAMSHVDWSSPEPDTGLEQTPPDRPPDAPPNILVVLVDDAGFADFGFQGSPNFKTPRIDSLVSEGVRFSQAYVTAPICSPSRAGLLSGRYQQRFGHESNPPLNGGPNAGLPIQVDTLADLLKTQGYTTAAIGKWHLGRARHFQPNRRGFDYFYGFIRGERSYFPQAEKGPQAIKRGTDHVEEEFPYLTDELGEDAARWIGENAHQPFFLYLAYSAVHMPLEALSEDLDGQDAALSGKRRKLAAMTQALDRSIGVVLDALDEYGLADDTVVFFLNDNGAGRQNQGDNSPLRGGKGNIYEGGVRVPFAIRWPGEFEPGAVYDPPVSALDIAATSLVAAGAEVPPIFDGVDLLPHVKGTAPGRPHNTLYWRVGQSWAIRDATYKLLSSKGEPVELYDLVTDPEETTDLRATQPDIVASLQRRYDSWAAQLIDPVFMSATESRRKAKEKQEKKEKKKGK